MKLNNKKYYLYLIKNKINNMVYIGQTDNANRRWKHHKNAGKTNQKKPIYTDMYNLGHHNFIFIVIATAANVQAANELEILLIEQYDSLYRYHSPKGYNLSKGGGNKETSDFTRNKLSKARAGIPLSQQHVQAISNGLIGHKLKEDTKEKIGKAQIGELNHFHGKKHSAETKHKMSQLASKPKYQKRKGSSSQYHGVSFATKRKRWSVAIKNLTTFISYKIFASGPFKTEKEAAMAANLHFMFNNINKFNYIK